jgi:tRNA(Ile)-lysidine synthase TilS/MesJ
MSGDSAEQLLLACRRHPLAAELSRGLDRARVEQGARVLVAASGGADSTALLALCAGLGARGRVAPVAGHVDHALRADSALELRKDVEDAFRVQPQSGLVVPE